MCILLCVVERTSFRTEVRQLFRDRALDAARDLTCAAGWDHVTMSAIAERIGVSRQALHKEMGAKQAVGEALVIRETDHFLSGIAQQLRRHPTNPVAGLVAAVEFTLHDGADNTLIKAIVAGAHGPDPGLLPLLSLQSGPVLGRAVAAITEEARGLYTPGTDSQLMATTVEVVVRLTLSHLLQPTGTIDAAVEQVHRVVAGLLPRP
jgi:AcrR family transcriptional regulator